MSTAFTVGEVVDITIRGARVTNSYPTSRDGMDTGLVVVAKVVGPDDPLGRNIAVNVMTPGVAVERVAPAEWPPQPGDLWRDRHGYLHFAASYSPDYDDTEDSSGIDDTGVRVVLLSQGLDETCTPGHQMHRPEHVNQRYGPLTLVHREQAEGEVSR